jgi:hypothetical protein
MTIGPAPMIRIDVMSVLLGIRSRVKRAQKKGALARAFRLSGYRSAARKAR